MITDPADAWAAYRKPNGYDSLMFARYIDSLLRHAFFAGWIAGKEAVEWQQKKIS